MTKTIGYLDPGSAGVILQMIGGGLAAVIVTMKLYGRRILRFFHLGTRPTDEQAASSSDRL